MQFHLPPRFQFGEFPRNIRIPTAGKLRRYLPFVAMAAGLAILLYVASQYWMMYAGQRRLAREWERQQAGNAQQATVVDDGLTRIFIPRINLSAVIVEGTNHKSLLLGPGHIKGTPSPGDVGNAVITGHRDTFFRHIYELDKGDIVIVQRSGRMFNYEVTGKEIVRSTDVSVLNASPDARLTLITCYPTYYIGPAPKRLVVFTRLADEKQAKIEPNAASPGKAVSAVAH